MGRHAVVENDAPTVELRTTAIRSTARGAARPATPRLTASGPVTYPSHLPSGSGSAPGALLTTAMAWVRAKSWSTRRSVATVVAAHLGLTALSCVLIFPSWLFWSVAIGSATPAVTKSRTLGPRLLVGLCVAAASCYLVRFAVISTLIDALGYDRTESVELSTWLAHPGSVVLGVALAAALDLDVRAQLRALWTRHQPALTGTPVRTALTVGLTLLVIVAALLPLARGLSSSRGFSFVTTASDEGSTTSSTSATTALGCSIDTSTGTADSTCTRNALIERVCHLDVTRVDPAGTSNGMTVWTDGASNMVKFSTNFTPTVPFTEGGIECVEHTTSNGYPAAQAHDLRLYASDWNALVRVGALPTELETRIAQA